MTELPSRLQRFAQELKRRRVFRVAVVYAAVAFIVWQAAEIAFPALNLPHWTLTFVVVLTLIGFPVSLALAWAFDVTPEGLTRTGPADVSARSGTKEGDTAGEDAGPDSAGDGWRWTAGRIAVAGAVVVLALAGLAMLSARGGDEVATIDHRVAVLPFENRTGDPGLDDLGVIAADWITDGLTDIDTVRVVPTPAVRELLAQVGPGSDPLPLLTRRTRARLAVTGSFVRVGDSLEVRAQLVDTEQGRVVTSFEPARSPRSAPTAALTSIRQQVVGAVATRFDDLLSRLPGQPPTYEAYQAYWTGVELLLAGRNREGIREYERAIAADSSFFRPWIGIIMAVARQPARMDSVLRLLEPHRSQLSEADRTFLASARAYVDGDLPGAYRAASEWHRRAPHSSSRWLAAILALNINRPREAVELIRSEPENSYFRSAFLLYDEILTDAFHVLGEHEEELNAAREARASFPGHPGAVVLEARALAGLHRPAEAVARADELLMLPASGMAAAGNLMRIGDALAAHGHDDAAQRVYARALDWWRDRGDPESAYELRSYANLLRRLGRLEEAAAYADEAYEAQPENRYAQRLVGIIAAQRGDRARAARIAGELAARDDPYDHGENTYNRARIRARLGDRDRAVELLRRAHAEGHSIDLGIRHDPDLRPLRGHPEYEELMRPKG